MTCRAACSQLKGFPQIRDLRMFRLYCYSPFYSQVSVRDLPRSVGRGLRVSRAGDNEKQNGGPRRPRAGHGHGHSGEERGAARHPAPGELSLVSCVTARPLICQYSSGRPRPHRRHQPRAPAEDLRGPAPGVLGLHV